MAEVKLRPWQRQIKSPGEAKEGEYVAFYGGTGLIASDMNNPEYKKNREEKLAKRAKRKEEYKKRVEDRQKKRDIRIMYLGAREYRNSEKFKKRLDAAYNRGLREGRPKANLAERAAKKKEKAQKLIAEAQKLESKAK